MGDDQEKELKTPGSRVMVVTKQSEFVGFLHTMSADRRESDVLNDERRFIHLTEVQIRAKGEIPKEVPFVAVNKASIIFVIPEGKRETDV